MTARHIARAILRFLGDNLALDALTPARAAAMYEAETRRLLDAKGQPVAAASHRTVLGQCKRFYAWAQERGYVTQNPFAAVKPVGKPKVGKAQLRIDEARRFVALAVNKAQQGDRAAIGALMALMLGMRAGEVLGRIVRDLDDGGRVLWITRGKTDNARRRLTVPEVLRPLLIRLAAGKSADALLLRLGPRWQRQAADRCLALGSGAEALRCRRSAAGLDTQLAWTALYLGAGSRSHRERRCRRAWPWELSSHRQALRGPRHRRSRTQQGCDADSERCKR